MMLSIFPVLTGPYIFKMSSIPSNNYLGIKPIPTSGLRPLDCGLAGSPVSPSLSQTSQSLDALGLGCGPALCLGAVASIGSPQTEEEGHIPAKLSTFFPYLE